MQTKKSGKHPHSQLPQEKIKMLWNNLSQGCARRSLQQKLCKTEEIQEDRSWEDIPQIHTHELEE